MAKLKLTEKEVEFVKKVNIVVAFERLGQAIDSLDSCTTGLITMTSLPDSIHVQGLRGSLPDIVEQLKKAFVDSTGEDPWNDTQPIIINEESLLMLGFKPTNWGSLMIEENGLAFEYWDGGLYLNLHKQIQIKYIHQLKSLYFLLTGKSLVVIE